MTEARRLRLAIRKACREAADLLERDGWCRGRTVDRDGRRCLVGALSKASVDPSTREDVYFPAAELVAQALEPTSYAPTASARLTAWNDRQDGPAPVVELLRRVGQGADGR